MEVLLSPTEGRKSPRKGRKLKASKETPPPKKKQKQNNNNKLLAFEFDEDDEDVKPSSKRRSSGNGDETQSEDEVPLSRLTTKKKKTTKTTTKKRKSASVVVQEIESDGDGGELGFGAHGGGGLGFGAQGGGDDDDEMVIADGGVAVDDDLKKTKKRKSAALVVEETESDGDGGELGFRAHGGGDDEEEMVTADGGVAVDDDLLLTPFSAFQTQETEDGNALEAQERRVKPRAASSLPIVFGEKVTKTKVLLECEGDAVDFSGDMGAVGRFTVDRNQEISLDLKGIIYKTTIVPSNTFFVVNVGQTEAKVECIMSDFVQLREETNCNENETMVEGTLKDFGFDSDEEREHLAVDGGEKADTTTEKLKQEEGADNGEQPKKKGKATKPLKSGKAPTKKAVAGKSKGGRVASAKGVGKKHTAKATKPKASKKG